MLATNGVILFAGSMLGPIYALFVEEVGGSLLDASFAGAAFAMAAGLTMLVSGRFSDVVKENELIVVAGYLILGLGFGAYLFVDSILFLLIVQVFIGLGEALYVPAFDSLYSKHLSRGMAGLQWGAWESMHYMVGAVAAVTGGFLATRFGFDPLFVIMSALSFLGAFYILLLPRKTL